MITGNEPITGTDNQIGLTIRQQFAAMAMQGFCATFRGDYKVSPELAHEMSKEAVLIADSLIAELNRV
jgi:hypothetical protein